MTGTDHAPTGHALVIGGSLAGMLAARALVPTYGRVTVLERDHLPTGIEPRAGVPQARHVHTLLMGGSAAIEALLPGFDARLAAAGAPRVDWPLDSLVHSQFGRWPRYSSDMTSRFASRELVESVVRQLATATPTIDVEDGRDVVGLLGSAERVTGVHVRQRGGDPHADAEDRPADLVVDASGRSSKATAWLATLGVPVPPPTEVDAHVGYASRYYQPAPGFEHDWKLLLVRNRAPGTRGGGIYTLEGGRWIVTLGGFAADYPAQDEDGFRAFAQSLGVPEFDQALQTAEPLGAIVGYRRTVNILHHFERAERWPAGFVALGDAACGFNPVYAQGMSVAALGARTLGATFAARDDPQPPRSFQRALARLLRGPWDLAVTEDYRYPGTEGPPRPWTGRLRARYTDAVLRAVVTDRIVHRTFIDVVHMIRPPADLGRPGILARVTGARLRHPTGLPPDG